MTTIRRHWLFAVLLLAAPRAWTACDLGWRGDALIDGESLQGWSVDAAPGAGGSLRLVPGLEGQALALDWNLGAGDYVQAVHTFPAPLDLSAKDMLGVSLRGGGPSETANQVTVMFQDADGVVVLHDMTVSIADGGINQIDRWLINLPVPRKKFQFGWGPDPSFDWARVARFFLAVKKVNGVGGGAGTLRMDLLQADRAADWPRPASFAPLTPAPTAAARALDYLLSQQDPVTGFMVSWKEEESTTPPAKSWLYDQALALIALTRAGQWTAGQPVGVHAQAAVRLARAVAASQRPDGTWPRGWNTRTGVVIANDLWEGDQAWYAMALAIYARKAADAAAAASARRGAAWLSTLVDPVTGRAAGHAEGDMDVWWALTANQRFADAAKVKDYLLRPGVLWDADLRYWWVNEGQPLVAMDAATWMSFFARHPSVGEAGRGLAALGVVRRALVTSSDDGSLCGLDGMGPMSVWNEGTAHFIAAGGEDGAFFLDALLAQQRPDGGMPGSPDAWRTTLGWLTQWTGLSSTAWLYFAVTGAPFLDVPEAFAASSNAGDARLAFDGDMSTRWGSDFSDPQWISRDLGEESVINKVTLDWETAHGKSYKVQVSQDGAAWTDVFSTTSSDGGRDEVFFDPVTARHVRLWGTERGTPWGYSLWEMKAENAPPVCTASSDAGGAALACDGNAATRWGSDFSDDQWLQADFGHPRLMDRVEVLWEAAYARTYRLLVSDDGQAWREVYSGEKDAPSPDVVFFPPTRARYLRLQGTSRGTPWGYSIWELRAGYVPVTASASTNSGDAIRVFDGDMSTRWGSAFSSTQWIALDFGEARRIGKVTLDWEAAYARSYRIQVSLNGAAWTNVFSTGSGDGGRDEVRFQPVTARHVRMLGLRRATPWGYSLWEMRADDAPAAGAQAVQAGPAVEAGGVYAFPNPARGRNPVVRVEAGPADAVELRFYDSSGELVHRAALSDPPALEDGGGGPRYVHTYAWDVSGVASGIYLCAVRALGPEGELKRTIHLAVLK